MVAVSGVDGTDVAQDGEPLDASAAHAAVDCDLRRKLLQEKIFLGEVLRGHHGEDARGGEGAETIDRQHRCLHAAGEKSVKLLLTGPVLADALGVFRLAPNAPRVTPFSVSAHASASSCSPRPS